MSLWASVFVWKVLPLTDCAFYLSFFITDPAVELFALQAEEVISCLQDATFSCYSAGSVKVVPGDHAHCDSSTLALSNGIRDLSGKEQESMTERSY